MTNDLLPIVLVVCLVVLTIVLVVVAINLIGVLMESKKVLRKANAVIDEAESKVAAILNPFHSLSAFVTNFTAGLKVAEGFMSFANKDKHKAKEKASDAETDRD